MKTRPSMLASALGVLFLFLQLAAPAHAACPADIHPIVCSGPGDGSNEVNVFDLFELLSNWNTNGSGANIAEPLDVVDVFDLFVLLSSWGTCPGTPCTLFFGCIVADGWLGDDACYDGPCVCSNGELLCGIDNPECFGSCYVPWIGKVVTHGTNVSVGDGCNYCVCNHGILDCTEYPQCFGGCYVPEIGKVVPHGTPVLRNGCIPCVCNHSQWDCSEPSSGCADTCFDPHTQMEVSFGESVLAPEWNCTCSADLSGPRIDCGDNCYVPELDVLLINGDIAVVDACTLAMCLAGNLMYFDVCTTECYVPELDITIQTGDWADIDGNGTWAQCVSGELRYYHW